jgi:hypothetical protein
MPTTDEKRFLLRDESGRGYVSHWTASEMLSSWSDHELDYSADPEDEFCQTLRQFVAESDVGDSFDNTDENWTMLRVD